MGNAKAGTVWEVSAGVLHAAQLKLWKQLGERGAEVIARLNEDPDYCYRVAKAMVGTLTPQAVATAMEASIARAMLGNNMFGVEEWQALYGVKFTKKQIRDAGRFPWREDVLNEPCPFNQGEQVRETHFAFLGLTAINGEPLTVKKWKALHPATGQPRFYLASNPWHAGQPHTDVATMEFRWYLLLKEIVPCSMNKAPEQQVAMLSEKYEVPSTIAEITKDILVFRKTNVRSNPARWVACKERTIKTSKVDKGLVSCVGDIDGHGLRVSDWQGDSYCNVGVGASRKFN